MHRTEGQNNVAGLFTGGPPATVVTPEWLNAVQEELLAVIAAGGMSPLTSGTDTRTQLLLAIQSMVRQEPYDYIVYDQVSFNGLWTRTGANAYDIKDDYRSVLIRIPEGGGGYACTGALSFLSGGDAYGVLSTNDCTHLKMENGTCFDVGDSLTYVNVDTEGAKLENVWIKGNGTTAVAFLYSFDLRGVSYLVLDGCKVSNRNGSTTNYHFYGEGNRTHKFINCSVCNCVVGAAIGVTRLYFSCVNLTNCSASLITVTNAAASVYVFDFCENLSNCTITLMTAGVAGLFYGFYSCYGMSSCLVYSVTAGSVLIGFVTSKLISACRVYDIESTGSYARGFSGCFGVVGCQAQKVDGNSASQVAGFSGCQTMAGCLAEDIDNAGAGSAEGFLGCNYAAAIGTAEAVNSGNDWVNTDDAQITNKFSVPPVFT